MDKILEEFDFKLPRYYEEIENKTGEGPKFHFSTPESTCYVVLSKTTMEAVISFDDKHVLISALHSTMDLYRGLIEVENGITAKGRKYIYYIIKALMGDQRQYMSYYAVINIEYQDKILQVLGTFLYRHDQDYRDNAIHDKFIKTFPEEDWEEDPYDKDFKFGLLKNHGEDEEYDFLFPEHPLSQARKLITEVIENN